MSRNNPSLPDSDKFNTTNETVNEGISSVSTSSDDDEFGQIPIRPRQRFTSEETEHLERIYQQFERPSAQVKQELADEFNTTVSRIQIWFQNRRAKAKKMGSSQDTLPDDTPDGASTSETQKRKTPIEGDADGTITQQDDSSADYLPLKEHASLKSKRKRSKSKREHPDSTSLDVPHTRSSTGFPFSTEFLTPSSLANESASNNPRFVHHRNPDMFYKLYPYGTRLFQELPATYQSFPTGYYQPYVPHYEEFAAMERSSNTTSSSTAPSVSSYIDPQKMSYARETEASTSTKPMNFDFSSESQDIDDDSKGFYIVSITRDILILSKDSKKKGKLPDRREK